MSGCYFFIQANYCFFRSSPISPNQRQNSLIGSFKHTFTEQHHGRPQYVFSFDTSNEPKVIQLQVYSLGSLAGGRRKTTTKKKYKHTQV